MTDLALLTEHILERPNCDIHYWLAGPEERPLVTMLHGAVMDHRMFNAQVQALAADYRVLVWDARGHGKSRPSDRDFTLKDCANDLVAILDHVNSDQAIVIGQSMGGYIAQYVYLHHPHRVNAMVIIGSTNIALPYARWEIWALNASATLFSLWPYQHLTRTIARSTAITPDVQAYALEVSRQLNHTEFRQIWQAVTQTIDTTGIPGHHIAVPLLLTHGDQDQTGSVRQHAPTWAAYEPDVTYTVIPDAGHNANQDNADFFNHALLEFLNTLAVD